jgi:hypothetical protein
MLCLNKIGDIVLVREMIKFVEQAASLSGTVVVELGQDNQTARA